MCGHPAPRTLIFFCGFIAFFVIERRLTCFAFGFFGETFI